MTISEAIKKLQEIQATHGDCQVIVADDNYDWLVEADFDVRAYQVDPPVYYTSYVLEPDEVYVMVCQE